MRQGPAKRLAPVVFALVAVAGFSVGGCSGDGVPGGSRHGGDDFDRDDIQVAVTECASEKRPRATARVTANTSPKDRTYFVGVNFLDSEGEVVDSNAQKLTPEPDSPDDEEITANVEFPMSDSGKAGEVASCEVDHAF